MYTKIVKNQFTSEDEKVPNVVPIVTHSIIALILIILFFGSFGTVGAGERGVKTRFDAIVGTVPQGLYFKMPFIEHVHILQVKTRTVNYDRNGVEGDSLDTSELAGASKDLQDVWLSVVVNYRINSDKVQNIFAQYSSIENYESNVVEPIIREVVKSTSAQYTAEELVTKRTEFSEKVNTILTQELTTKDAILEKSSITNFRFSKAFSDAIEAKVTAVQNAEAQKNKLEQVKYEAQQQIEKAKAEAESIRIQAQAVTSQGGEDYVKLQALKVWDGKGCTSQCFGANTQMPVPFFNLNK